MPIGANSFVSLSIKLNGTDEPLFRSISGTQVLSAVIAAGTSSILYRCMSGVGSALAVNLSEIVISTPPLILKRSGRPCLPVERK